jgi:hypothetical protein
MCMRLLRYGLQLLAHPKEARHKRDRHILHEAHNLCRITLTVVRINGAMASVLQRASASQEHTLPLGSQGTPRSCPQAHRHRGAILFISWTIHQFLLTTFLPCSPCVTCNARTMIVFEVPIRHNKLPAAAAALSQQLLPLVRFTRDLCAR